MSIHKLFGSSPQGFAPLTLLCLVVTLESCVYPSQLPFRRGSAQTPSLASLGRTCWCRLRWNHSLVRWHCHQTEEDPSFIKPPRPLHLRTKRSSPRRCHAARMRHGYTSGFLLPLASSIYSLERCYLLRHLCVVLRICLATYEPLATNLLPSQS